jgi:hypothetical protein
VSLLVEGGRKREREGERMGVGGEKENARRLRFVASAFPVESVCDGV